MHLLTYGLLHANVAHLAGNVLGLLAFGIPLEMRVGRAGTLAILVGGVIAGGALHSWGTSSGDDVPLVGISAGVYAFLAAPLALDPLMRTVLVIRGMTFPVAMWARVVAMIVLWSLVDALAHPNVAVLGHLGGALAGIALAIPMRRVRASDAYARWRLRQEQRAAALE